MDGKREIAEYNSNLIHMYIWDGSGLFGGWKVVLLREKESRNDLSNSMFGWMFSFVYKSQFCDDTHWKVHLWYERWSFHKHVSGNN